MPVAAATPDILVVDDDVSICRSCERVLAGEGCAVRTVHSGHDALEILQRQPADIVVADLQMADVGVLALLKVLDRNHAETAGIVITGHATIRAIVEARKLGAFDYVSRPFTPEELIAVVQRVWDRRRRALPDRAARGEDGPVELAGLIAWSPAMQAVVREMRKAAPTSGTVLIVGESGSGHADAARAIHALGPRQHARFAAVSGRARGAVPLEQALFGWVAADGVAAGEGIVASADRGTLFLDEIGDVDVTVQTGLVRLIHEREYLPVGATEARAANVRLILAASGDLERLAADEAFREGFSSRVHVFPIALPPLRERREDIGLLASRALEREVAQRGWLATTLSAEALAVLERYDWPGNLAELDEVVGHAVATAVGGVIEPRHLPRRVVLHGLPGAITAVPRSNAELLRLKRECRQQAAAGLERDFVVEALARHDWNVTRASRDVGLQRANFQALMRRHAVRSPRGRQHGDSQRRLRDL